MKSLVPFSRDPGEAEETRTIEERLETAEHEWQAWKQIAHEYWLEIQRLRALAQETPEETQT